MTSSSCVVRDIERLIEAGLAYAVDVERIGTFVCLDAQNLRKANDAAAERIRRLEPTCVQYPVVPMRDPAADVALWAPYSEGSVSPWGRGLATVNGEYVGIRDLGRELTETETSLVA